MNCFSSCRSNISINPWSETVWNHQDFVSNRNIMEAIFDFSLSIYDLSLLLFVINLLLFFLLFHLTHPCMACNTKNYLNLIWKHIRKAVAKEEEIMFASPSLWISFIVCTVKQQQQQLNFRVAGFGFTQHKTGNIIWFRWLAVFTFQPLEFHKKKARTIIAWNCKVASHIFIGEFHLCDHPPLQIDRQQKPFHSSRFVLNLQQIN